MLDRMRSRGAAHGRIGMLRLRVALAPERVPRLVAAFSTGVDQLSVDRVDVVRRVTAKRDCDPVSPRGRRPVRVERPDGLLAIEREAEPSRQRRLDVAVALGVRILGELQPEPRVEVDRPFHVGHDHTDDVEMRHVRILAPERRTHQDASHRVSGWRFLCTASSSWRETDTQMSAGPTGRTGAEKGSFGDRS